MTYTLDEIFNQALEDKSSANVDSQGYEARIGYGTKITRDKKTGKVEFFNSTTGGGFYQVLSVLDIENFLQKGWKVGAYVLYLSNNRTKLDLIDRMVRKEINSSNNPASIKSLKAKKERVIKKYNKINLKLKSIQNGTD